MAKSITWIGTTATAEIQQGQNHEAFLQIMPDNNFDQLVVVTLNLDDLKGIIDIMTDIRYDIESDIRDAAAEKEVSNG